MKHHLHKIKKVFSHYIEKTRIYSTSLLTLFMSLAFLGAGFVLLWFVTLSLPDLDTFDKRKVSESTKIYDRTGEVVLYDIHENIQRTIITTDEISVHAKNAIVAIEDDEFYQHHGVDIRATIRAVLYTILGKFGIKDTGTQGGSTITQQVIKNTLLTSDRNISRKIKEWFLATRLEQKLTKDEILTQYLNVAPYGGTMYGIEEASRSFFGIPASDLSVAQSAYLAALPNAPTFYSPYGQNRDKLEDRKNLVLSKMLELGFIDHTTYTQAKEEQVVFKPQKENSAKALHFVQYVHSYLEQKYGRDIIENGGLRVITTLDYDIQQVAEETVFTNAQKNEADWNAHNQGAVVINPQTGEILTMVGSRDYFDEEHDGNFNVTLAKRQPGSAFKPFIYATAFEKGYTDETVVFDVPTQFSTTCSVDNMSSENGCYSPQNYDGKFLGPITFRNALAQSRNIPAVKALYLAGLEDSLRTAKNMGISTLDKNTDRYGLTLVLGGGEVSLLDMTSAYGVFATNGVRNDPVFILRIEDKDGNILEELEQKPRQVLGQNAASIINSILSDNQARTPLFGSNSFLYFGDSYDVAGKTGTTNNNKDAWLIGYSPNVVVGVWTGNNDNTPMKKGSSISGPTWRTIMETALQKYPRDSFLEPAPDPDYYALKPILRGIWRGGDAIPIDRISGKKATELTPKETLDYIVLGKPHSILHWVSKNNPRGPIPNNPGQDNQYQYWETSVQKWLQNNPVGVLNQPNIPSDYDDVHTDENKPRITIQQPTSGRLFTSNESVTVLFNTESVFPIALSKIFLNEHYLGSTQSNNFSFTLNESPFVVGTNVITIQTFDNIYNNNEKQVSITVTE